MEAGDADAVFTMGASYMYGDDDTQQDIQKALELFLRAVQLGSIEAHNKIGSFILMVIIFPKIQRRVFTIFSRAQ